MEAIREERARRRFLERHRIRDAAISGIKAGRKAILQSYGIDTAADVNERAVGRVRGFGRVLTRDLLAWLRTVERRFVSCPAPGVDPADVAALDAEMAAMRSDLERERLQSAGRLHQIVQQTGAARKALPSMIEQGSRLVAQAKADARVL